MSDTPDIMTLQSRIEELERALRNADNVRGLYEDAEARAEKAEARLRAVTEAGDAMREYFRTSLPYAPASAIQWDAARAQAGKEAGK